MTAIRQVAQYTTPTYIDPSSDVDAVARLFAMRRAGSPIIYSIQVFHYDLNGNPAGNRSDGDISSFIAVDNASASIRFDSTAAIPDSINLTVSAKEPFTFGSDQIHVYSLLRSDNYNRINGYVPGTYIRFDMGQFVVTTPGIDDLDISDQQVITGYGTNYRLSKGMRDSYAFAAGTTKAGMAIQTLMRGAGVLGSTAALSTICDYQGSWWDGTTTIAGATDKIFAQPMSYPLGGSVNDYLSAINEILQASGQRWIYTQPNGRWMIEPQPDVAHQAVRWLFAGSPDPLVTDADLLAKTIIMHESTYNGDVHDVPNQFVFIQNGLDFEPGGDGKTDGSSGLYVIDNLTTPPAGQQITGEIRPTVIGLDAMGQADLVTQANTYYADAQSQVETISLQIASWPVMRYFDIFYFVHNALQFSSQRRLQAQSWEYFLFGNPSTVQCNAVGLT